MLRELGEPAVAPDGSDIRLLLVEDNPGDARLVQIAFEGSLSRDSSAEAYQLTVVDNLADAMRAASGDRFDLILLDLGLPDSVGLQGLHQLRARDEETPILVLTGNSDEGLGLEAVRSGAQDYLVKGDIDARSLAKSVRFALERARLAKGLLRAHSDLLARERIAEAVSFALQRFLRDRHWQDSMESVLEQLRAALDAELAIVVCQRASNGEGIAAAQSWMTGENQPSPDRLQAESMLRSLAGTTAAADRQPFSGLIRDLPAGLADPLSILGAQTALAVPLHCAGSTCGAIIFADARPDRSWSAAEVDAVESIGAALEAAIEAQAAAEAVIAREHRFRSLVENSWDGVVITDAASEIKYASQSAARLLGYQVDDVIGQLAFGMTHPDDLARVKAAFQSTEYREQGMTRIEARVRRADGTYRWMETIAADMRGDPDLDGVVLNYRDITDRKAAVLDLEKSERHFRSVIENASDLIAILSPDGRSTYLSPSTERMLGMPVESLLGECVFDYIHPEDLKRARQALQTAFDQPGSTHAFTCRLLHPEKGWIDIDAVGKAEQYDGRLQVVLTARDISQRRVMEHELRQERDRFQLLAEHGPVGIVQVDPDGSITFANPEAERVLGLERSEINGRSYDDPSWSITDFNGEPFPADQLPFAQVKRTLQPVDDVRHAITWPDGERKLLSISGVPIVDAQGELDSAVLAIKDVTDAVRSEQALAASERRFRSLVQNASDIITIVDSERKIRYESPSLERVMGYSPEDVLGLDVLEPVHPADRARIVNAFQQLIDDPASVMQEEIQLIGADGAFRTLEVVGTNLLADPAVKGIVLNSRDITDRRRHDREQEAIIQMAAALREAGNRDEMVPIILRQVQELFSAGGAALVTLNAKQQDLLVEMATGSWKRTTGMKLSGDSVIDWDLYRSRQPYVQADVRADKRFKGAEMLGPDTAAVAVPLFAQGEPFGTVWAGRSTPFEDEETRILSALTDMAANALRRASLHEETQRRAAQLTTVTHLGLTLGETLELPVIFERLADATHNLLNEVTTVLISRYRAEEQRVECVYGLQAGEPLNVSELAPVALDPAGRGTQSEVIHQRRHVILGDVQSHLAQADGGMLFSTEGPTVESAVLVPMLARGQVIGVVQAYSSRPQCFDETDAELLAIVANTAAVAIANADLFAELQSTNVELALAYDTTLEGWARALEMRDKETEGHTRRVTELTLELATWLGLPTRDLVDIRRGALLHDIGKMGIPDSILLKPGPLDEAEWEIMRTHPQLAQQMLADVDFLRAALTIPMYHHERWDGSGYPHGLTGEDIPIEARAFAVVDVYDALRSDRPYRQAWPQAKVHSYLTDNAGVLFDPRVVDAFFEMTS